MDFLNNIDTSILLICGGLCCGGVILVIFSHIIGGAFGVFFGLFDVVINFVSGGPVAWCGCLGFLMLFGVCAFITISIVGVLSTCGTPDAVKFCELF
jgi:hypothetical protein